VDTFRSSDFKVRLGTARLAQDVAYDRSREAVKAVKPAGAIPERPGSSAPKAHDPLKQGFTPDAGRL